MLVVDGVVPKLMRNSVEEARHARQQQFRSAGVAIVEYALTQHDLQEFEDCIPETGSRTAGRRIVDADFQRLSAHGVLNALAADFCSEGHRAINQAPTTRLELIRAIAFNKTPDSNWFVPWHQDRVRECLPANGRPVRPTLPPDSCGSDQHRQMVAQKMETGLKYLNSIVTLRVHLDECAEDDGPIEVILGSHTKGVLNQDGIEAVVRDGRARLCLVARGDILAMSPLIVHRSQRAKAPGRRRVLHLEYFPVSELDFQT